MTNTPGSFLVMAVNRLASSGELLAVTERDQQILSTQGFTRNHLESSDECETRLTPSEVSSTIV